jgi:hypothetical protein
LLAARGEVIGGTGTGPARERLRRFPSQLTHRWRGIRHSEESRGIPLGLAGKLAFGDLRSHRLRVCRMRTDDQSEEREADQVSHGGPKRLL